MWEVRNEFTNVVCCYAPTEAKAKSIVEALHSVYFGTFVINKVNIDLEGK